MGVPEKEVENFDEIKAKGPTSKEAIQAGVRYLAKIAAQFCKDTPDWEKKTVAGLTHIVTRAIAKYKVNSQRIPPPGDRRGYDVTDKYNYDFSSDIIARAKYKVNSQ